MAAGNWIMYGHALEKILDGTIDVANDSFRIVLVTSLYTPAQNTDDAWSDISANEVSGTGYTANGGAINLTVSRSANVVTIDGEDETWASSTITARYAVIVRDADSNGSLATTDIPLAYLLLDTTPADVSTTSADFTITMNANGIGQFTAATS